MDRTKPLPAIVLALVAGVGLSGCGSAPDGISEVGSLGFIGAEPKEGSPASNYVRIARGAKACWFGASGPLNGTHLFTGEVKPASAGGSAAIVLYERAPDGRRGLRAFTVEMAGKGEGTALARANERVPEPLGSRMLADVDRWADGETGCEGAAAGWAPADPQAVPVEDLPKKKPGKKGAST